MVRKLFYCEICDSKYFHEENAIKCESDCKEVKEHHPQYKERVDVIECYLEISDIAKIIILKHEKYYDLPRKIQEAIIDDYVGCYDKVDTNKLWNYLDDQNLKKEEVKW